MTVAAERLHVVQGFATQNAPVFIAVAPMMQLRWRSIASRAAVIAENETDAPKRPPMRRREVAVVSRIAPRNESARTEQVAHFARFRAERIGPDEVRQAHPSRKVPARRGSYASTL
jgi:hypothetical protein